MSLEIEEKKTDKKLLMESEFAKNLLTVPVLKMLKAREQAFREYCARHRFDYDAIKKDHSSLASTALQLHCREWEVFCIEYPNNTFKFFNKSDRETQELREIEKTLNDIDEVEFICAVRFYIKKTLDTSTEKGFHNREILLPEAVALMHSELSEMLEAYRDNIDKSEHIPDFTAEEEELADVIIRAFDWAGLNKLRLPEAIIEKMKFNDTRSFRHGEKRI